MKKYYTFAMILYKDSLTYDYYKIIKYIEENYKYYAYIEHEPDTEHGKVHTHVLIHFDNKRYNTGISKELNIPSNYIQNANLVPYLRYLIHFDNEEKKQYSVEDVKGTLKQKLIDSLNTKQSETEQVATIMSFIIDYNGWLYITELAQFVIANGVYSAFRRNYSFFKDLVLDHNKHF